MRPVVVKLFGTFHKNVPVFGVVLIVLKVAPLSVEREISALPKGKSGGTSAVSHVIVCVEPTAKVSPPFGEVTVTVTEVGNGVWFSNTTIVPLANARWHSAPTILQGGGGLSGGAGSRLTLKAASAKLPVLVPGTFSCSGLLLNVPSPRPAKTPASLPGKKTKARSSVPSPSISAATIPTGVFPSSSVFFDSSVKVPSPLPKSMETVLVCWFSTARSVLPSRLKSSAMIWIDCSATSAVGVGNGAN